MSHPTSAVLYQDWLVVVIEEHPSPCCFGYETSGWHAHHFHDCRHLVILVLSCKDRHADETLEHNAAERPHVDGRGVGNAQHDLRRPVEPTLNVSVESLRLKATRAVVYQFDLALVHLHQQHVLRLQVTVHDRELVHVVQSLQDLDAKPLGQGHREALEVVVLDELVQVDGQHLKRDEHVTPEGEVVFDPDDVLAVLSVMVPQSLQDSNLDFTLLMELLPVLENLKGDSLLVLVVVAPHHDSKSASTQLLLHFVSVVYLVLSLVKVVSLVVVEAVIVDLVRLFVSLWVLVLVRQRSLHELADAFVLGVEGEVVDDVKSSDLVSLILTQHVAILPQGLLRAHRELGSRVNHRVAVGRLTGHSRGNSSLYKGVLTGSDH